VKYRLALLSALLASAMAHAGTVSNIEALSPWKCSHDQGTPGTSEGATSLADSPSKDGQARRFDISWNAYGGERCSSKLAPLDGTSTTFTLDLWWFVTDMTHVNNMEFDLNQVLPNRDTVIYGTQCSFSVGKWKFTTKVGTDAHWNISNATCSKAVWTANTWHHLVLQFHRDATGVVTYDSVSLDDDLQAFHNASGQSNFALRWYPPGLQVVNFQMDGGSSGGDTTAYLKSVIVTGSGSTSTAPPFNLKGTVLDSRASKP
jgi:hypothetical protein